MCHEVEKDELYPISWNGDFYVAFKISLVVLYSFVHRYFSMLNFYFRSGK